MTFLRRTAATAALVLGAAVAPLVATAPAHAAGCSGPSGYSVVVDFAELGGGVTAGCADVPDGTRANAVLKAAGYSLTMATKSPGFLCRVNGAPASDPCVEAAPADAYWSVWWADGKGGNWVYSARGIDSLRVPEGGYMALSWHQGSGRSQPPATVPVSREVKAPAPTKKPGAPKKTEAPASGGSGQGTAPRPPSTTPAATSTPAPGATTSSSAAPSTAPSATPTTAPSAAPSGTPEPGESVAVDPALPAATEIEAGPDTVQVEASGAEDDSLPVWVPVLLVLAVVGVGAGAVAWRRTGA